MAESALSQTAADNPQREYITGAILAGGLARRMGGEDKGLVRVGGQAMVVHVSNALQPQVQALVINANRNQERYAQLCSAAVVPDSVEGFAGPLAGMASVMQCATTPFILSVPCDSPLITTDLAYRLWFGLTGAGADLAVAHDGLRLQPVFALLKRELLPSMLAYLESGERKIDRWFEQHHMQPVDFSDHPDTFLNINTPAERDALTARLTGG